MTSVPLTPHQQDLKKIIEENLAITRNWQETPNDQVQEAFQKMKKAAHELHMSISPHPKHHKYMIENRGLLPEDPEFYNHIHPTEDLLSYLNDINANDDPIDHTLGDTFYFEVFTRRWGHKDRYRLTRNQNGWDFSALSYNGQCDKDGSPVLYQSLEHDSVGYPNSLSSVLYSIWYRAESEGLTHKQVQDMLNETAEWVNLCEKNTPSHILV